MEKIISICGLFCNECPFYEKECTGCKKAKGKIFWTADHTENGVCPLYDCSVNTRKHSHCGNCNELPCETFKTMKDPSCSDEEHVAMLKTRVERLNML